jgi:uncharacterized SAM-binding protein YcdF (DUF218 family)
MIPMWVSDVAKALIPGSFAFLVGGVSIGAVLLFAPGRARQIGRVGIALLALVYLTLANPVVSERLRDGLAFGAQLSSSPVSGEYGEVIVVMGNGVISYAAGGKAVHAPLRRTAFNLIEAARVYQRDGASLMIVSGGIANPSTQLVSESEVMRDALIALGVAAELIVMESSSRNTYEQVRAVANLLADRHITRFTVITVPEHVRRGRALFRRANLEPVLRMSPLHYALAVNGRRPLFSIDALRGSEAAIYEYLALVAYSLQGRL